MDDFDTLSAAIATVLDTVQMDSVAAFAEIDQYPTLEFGATPAATVAPSDNTSDYATNVQNLRTYVFNVDLYVPIQQVNNGGLATAFSTMRQLTSLTLNAFDMSNTLSGACQILVPTPSVWGTEQSSLGVLLTARIMLSAKLTVVTNNG